METTDFSGLEALLGTYRKNLKQVPEEQLKTKYKAGWDALIEKICTEASRVAKDYCLSGMEIYRDDWMDPGGIVEQINAAYASGGYGRRLGRALFRNMDPDEFRIILKTLREKVEALYAEYMKKRKEKNGQQEEQADL